MFLRVYGQRSFEKPSAPKHFQYSKILPMKCIEILSVKPSIIPSLPIPQFIQKYVNFIIVFNLSSKNGQVPKLIFLSQNCASFNP